MYLLTRNNVDGYPSHDKFEEEPTEQELYEILVPYYDEEESREASQKLLRSGYVSMDDGSGTTYELEKI